MKIYLQKVFLILACCLCHLVQATAQTGRFYSTNTGITSSLVNQIFQDKKGFIWIATEYGLNKFDGLRFSNYKHIENDSTSIKNNYVRTLFEDSRENLLIGCINGLMRYDREKDAFNEIPMRRVGKQVFPHITKMTELHNGEIWIVTAGQGIFRLGQDLEEAQSVEFIMNQINYNFYYSICEDSQHNIWIGTEGYGLLCYFPETEQVRVFRDTTLNDNNISSVIEDKNGNLFIGTQKQGLFQYDRHKNLFIPIPYSGNGALSIYCMEMVNDKLLIGADGQGLKIYNPVSRQVEDYMINAAPLDFAKGKIHAIMEDRDKNLWLALFQKGVVLIPRQGMPFEYFGAKLIRHNPIGQGAVMSIYQDSDRRLWIGTDNEGVFELNENGKQINHYKPDGSASSVANTIMCMYEDSEKNFWMGSYSPVGLAKLNRKTGRCEHPLPIDNKKIYAITEDRHKNLYIGTFGSGFYRYNLITRKLYHYESSKQETGDLSRDELANDWINCIFCDSEGLVWLGHYKGVSCFNPLTGSFINYKNINALIEDKVGYALMEDHAGHIWAGTTDGLYCFDKKTEEMKIITIADGLPNNVICGLSEDDEKNIWISTYHGICKYDAANNRFINYYEGDGLQGNEFTHGAYYKDTTGKIYFGGINGITSFYPKTIGNTSKETEVKITDFLIFGQPVNKDTRSGERPVIYTSVMDANLFQLSYTDNTFSIVFSTLEYNNPEQIAYQYKIDELSGQWLSTEPGVNRVTYNNLPPGRYTFQVRALRHGSYSGTRTLKILITPPWYQMWWAYCIYIASFALLLVSIANYILARTRHRREMMQREHAEQINEAKLQFFINISHEIRTPMTLIINPLEKLLSARKDDELHKTYLMIYRNAQRILRLINQLMDIRKIDKGQMYMKMRETDIVGFVDDIVLTFDWLAKKKNIHFSFEHAMSQLKVWVDLNNFDKILMNIVSNAFKYTPEHGEIKVILSTGQDSTRKDALKEYFEIIVIDSGIGIDRSKIEKIFERFYQIDNDVTKTNFGTGIGLHLAHSLVELHHGIIWAENREEAQGSRFIIRLPLGFAHLMAGEMEDADLSVKHQENLANQKRREADEALWNEDANGQKSSVKPKNRLRLLIVEDEEDILTYLKEELRDEYRITTCKNGKEAYSIILTNTPDLVVSDVMMPEMDGLTLCRKVKQNTNINHIPIILLTAKSTQEDMVEGLEIGADAYIAKPFSTELLKSTIANIITNRKLLRNKFTGNQQQEDKIQRIALKSSDELLMDRIMKVINENLSNSNLSVEMLAQNVGLSRVHIHRKLKELTNLSTRDFIRNIRLQQATALLKEDKLTISDIAYATGYTCLSHFSTSFREVYGMTPTEYMKSYRKEQ